ncbi:MAG: hypothetical protein GEU82_02165 [Luteitalea sp.]|nr:hypothetical protein [Luteitalea sp.]
MWPSRVIVPPFGGSTTESGYPAQAPEDDGSAPRRIRRFRSAVHVRIDSQSQGAFWLRARVHVTFLHLTETFQPERRGAPQDTGRSPTAATIERDIIDILKRVSRRPIQPTGASELLADLGFDSLQVLELVGELEDHFNIAVPLNTLTHIRTVGDIAGEVHRLTSAAGSST